jgi:hypothetical protein
MSENIKKIIEYFSQNKNSFSREELIATLLKAGYCSEEIDQGIKSVYENQPTQASQAAPVRSDFWDFQTKKTYFDSSEKWMDILSGFALSIILAGLLSIIFFVGIILFYAMSIVLIVFFSSRRAFMTMGLAIGLLISPVIAGILMEIIGGRFFSNNSFF